MDKTICDSAVLEKCVEPSSRSTNSLRNPPSIRKTAVLDTTIFLRLLRVVLLDLFIFDLCVLPAVLALRVDLNPSSRDLSEIGRDGRSLTLIDL